MDLSPESGIFLKARSEWSQLHKNQIRKNHFKQPVFGGYQPENGKCTSIFRQKTDTDQLGFH